MVRQKTKVTNDLCALLGLVIIDIQLINWHTLAPSSAAFFQQQTLKNVGKNFVATFDHGCTALTEGIRSEGQQVIGQARHLLRSVSLAEYVDQYAVVDDATGFELVE